MGCALCKHHGVIPTGITAAQVERLVEEAQRLTWKDGDIARYRAKSGFGAIVLFIVTWVSEDGREIAGGTGSGFIKGPAVDFIRVGRVGRQDGQPC